MSFLYESNENYSPIEATIRIVNIMSNTISLFIILSYISNSKLLNSSLLFFKSFIYLLSFDYYIDLYIIYSNYNSQSKISYLIIISQVIMTILSSICLFRIIYKKDHINYENQVEEYNFKYYTNTDYEFIHNIVLFFIFISVIYMFFLYFLANLVKILSSLDFLFIVFIYKTYILSILICLPLLLFTFINKTDTDRRIIYYCYVQIMSSFLLAAENLYVEYMKYINKGNVQYTYSISVLVILSFKIIIIYMTVYYTEIRIFDKVKDRLKSLLVKENKKEENSNLRIIDKIEYEKDNISSSSGSNDEILNDNSDINKISIHKKDSLRKSFIGDNYISLIADESKRSSLSKV